MNATDVQKTLDMALEKTNVREVNVRHRPRLLTDNRPCYLSHELKEYLKDNQMNHTWCAISSPDSGQDRALPQDDEECSQIR